MRVLALFGVVCALQAAAPQLSPRAALLRDAEALGGCQEPEATVQINPLKGFKELQKVHHSWPIPEHYLQSSDKGFVDGLMHDYVRITGACALSLEGLNRTLLDTCAEICDAVAAARTGPAPTITVNYSPWYQQYPGKDPTVTGEPEDKEMEELEKQLSNLKAWLPSAGTPRSSTYPRTTATPSRLPSRANTT